MSTSTLASRVDELASTCTLTRWQGDPERCRWCDGWLGRGAPRSPLCSTPCRHAFWANHSWKKAKEEARERAGRRCEGVLDDGSRCGAPSTATHQVHHRHGAQEGGRPRTASCAHHQAGLVFLCRSCHHLEHHPPQHPHPSHP